MLHSLDSVTEREIVPGFHGRFVHSDTMTFAYWRIEKDALIPTHSHPHEQVVNMLSGQLELIVDGTAHTLKAGDVFTIPGHVTHSARGLTGCRVLDVFSPVREDYRNPTSRTG